VARTPEIVADAPAGMEPVIAWRRETLIRAGYEDERAERIARSDADLHIAVKMIEQGCDAELAERILT
jgi:hypothetical protein